MREGGELDRWLPAGHQVLLLVAYNQTARRGSSELGMTWRALDKRHLAVALKPHEPFWNAVLC